MHGQWLRGLAENPATPTEILIRLLEPDTRTAWETLCSTRDLPQAVIDAILAHPNPLVTQYFAKNRKVDPGQLARLLDNPHPRASYWLVDGIRKQGRQMPDDLISRLLRHEDPLMTRVEWFEELRIVLSGEAMRRAARHTDPLMREWSCGSW